MELAPFATRHGEKPQVASWREPQTELAPFAMRRGEKPQVAIPPDGQMELALFAPLLWKKKPRQIDETDDI